MRKLFLILVFICLFTNPIFADEGIKVLNIPEGQSNLLEVKELKRVAVTDPEIAEVVVVSSKEILINGINEGVTTLHVWQADRYERIIIKVYFDEKFILEEIKQLINNPDIQVIKLKDTIILKGMVLNQHERQEVLEIASCFSAEVIDLLKVKEPLQVLIKAYVIEINREDKKELGLEWGGLVRGVFKPGQLNFGQLNRDDLPVQLDLLGIRLDALQRDNLTKLLTAPEIVTSSGNEARILVGGEIPVIKNDDIVWKPYGIILNVTPKILKGGDIEVSLEPEVSTVDWDNAVKLGEYLIPAFKTRRLKTEVTVEDGSVIVLGGLINENDIQEVNKVPFLSDLPILGEFFQSSQFRKGKSELVIMVQTWIMDERFNQRQDVIQNSGRILEKGVKVDER